METGIKENKLLFSFVGTLIGSIILIVTLFMPFASATGNNKKWLENNLDEIFYEEIEMTNKEAVNISLFEFGKIYYKSADIGMFKDISIACFIVICAFALFAILTTLFSLLKKPIAIIIFNILSLVAFILLKWDFKDRGAIPSSSYDWGIAQYFCYLGVIITFVSAVTLLAVKIKQRKQSSF